MTNPIIYNCNRKIKIIANYFQYGSLVDYGILEILCVEDILRDIVFYCKIHELFENLSGSLGLRLNYEDLENLTSRFISQLDLLAQEKRLDKYIIKYDADKK